MGGVDRSLALSLENLLQGEGLVKKSAALSLLSGMGAKLSRASDLPSPAARCETLPTRVPALDRLLEGGLPRGGFVEISSRRSAGRFSIGLSTLAAATSAGEAAALVDLGGHLDPQAAEASGVDLARLLWVRPEKLKGAVASAEMLLATGFPLVVVDLGLPPVRGRFVPDAAWLRLARAARTRGTSLLLLSPYRVSGIAADAVVAADAARPVWNGAGRAPRLLDGLASRLSLEKDARARSGKAEEMGLKVDSFIPTRPEDVLMTRLPLSNPLSPQRGERVRERGASNKQWH
jgi:hypothetical protein